MKINLICNNVLPEYSAMNEFDKYLHPVLFSFFSPFFFFALNNYSVFLKFTYVQYVRLVPNVFRYRCLPGTERNRNILQIIKYRKIIFFYITPKLN